MARTFEQISMEMDALLASAKEEAKGGDLSDETMARIDGLTQELLQSLTELGEG